MITKQDVSLPLPPREDSHAFSLEALAAREAARRNAPAQAADDSGVIDLDALRGTGSLADDMVTQRLVPVPAAPAPAPERNTPRWALATLGVLGGAVVTLATMVAVGVPHGTPATQDPSDPPTMAAASLTAPDTAHEHRLEIEGAIIPDAKPAAPAPVATEAPTAEPVAAKRSTRTKRSSKAKSKAKSSSKPKVSAPKTSTPAPAPAPKAKDDLSVSCIIDPASCGRGSKPTKPKAAPSAPAGNLPDKLSAAQIRKALSGPKAKAKQCGDMHAAPAGTKVKVKLSVAGSGDVRSATPLAPHSNSLGRCVANALEGAKFDRFAAPAMGVVYSVRL